MRVSKKKHRAIVRGSSDSKENISNQEVQDVQEPS